MYVFLRQFFPLLFEHDAAVLLAGLVIALIGAWTGWNSKWKNIMTHLLVAVAVYILALWLCWGGNFILAMIGLWLCIIAPLSALGAVLGKLISLAKSLLTKRK